MGEGERRRAVYAYIVQYIQAHSYAPSLREIGAAVGLNSTAAVEYHLKALVQEGLLTRQRYVARGLTIVRKQPQREGGDERDTHFRGWAEWMWGRLMNNWNEEMNTWDRDATEIIAQAAYDLVRHVLDCTAGGYYTSSYTGMGENADMADVSDWPWEE